LWKVYKKDRKLVKILLKNGALDDYLDSGDTVSFESLKALVELNRETGSTDTISREFDFFKNNGTAEQTQVPKRKGNPSFYK
jgi:hypothetical protein